MKKHNMKRILAVFVMAGMILNTAGCGVSLIRVEKKAVSIDDLIQETFVGEEVSGQNNTLNQEIDMPEGEAVAETALTGKLSVQIFINENGVGEEAWTQILSRFEALNPELELTTYIGPNVNSQLASKWTSGKGTPDIVLLDGKGLSEYTLSAAGSFLDLKDWFQEATVYGSTQKIVDKMNTNVLELYGGKQYKAPLMLNCYGLWYDEASYDTLELSVHKDFSGVMANATTLKNAGQTSLIYPGMYSNYLVWGTIMPAVAAYGQEFFNEVVSAKNPEIYQDERFVSILENLQKLGNAGYISASATQDHLGAQSDWLNHRSALVSSGIWLEAEMKNSIPGTFDMKFTTAGLNAQGQKPGVALMSVGTAISSGTENEENAKTFLRYLYQDSSLQELALSYGYGTVAKKQLSPKMYNSASQGIMEYIQSDEVTIVYKTSDWGNVGETFNNVANQIAQGSLSVEEGSRQLVAAAQKN